MLKRKTDEKTHHPLVKGSGAAMADGAVEASPSQADHHPDTPHARAVRPLPAGKPDQLAKKVEAAESRQEALLDEAIEESFPGSDPISPSKVD